MTRHAPTGHLVGIHEIAERLGVDRSRAHVIAESPGFPDAADVLSCGKVWLATDVDAWIRECRPVPPKRGVPPGVLTLSVLAFLRDQPGVVSTEEVAAAFPGVKFGTLYTVLMRLAKRGQIAKGKAEKDRRVAIWSAPRESAKEAA